MRADLRGDGAARADRNRNDNEIGTFGGGGIGFDDLVGETKFRDPTARRGGAGGGDDGAGSALRARRARDGGADQAIPISATRLNTGFPLIYRPGSLRLRNSASASTTRRLASSLPTLMRSAFGSL